MLERNFWYDLMLQGPWMPGTLLGLGLGLALGLVPACC